MSETARVSMSSVGASLDRLMRISGGGVYAEPLEVGDDIVIAASRTDARNESPGRRVGVIHAAPDGVRFRPAIDLTQLVMTAGLAAFVVWRLSRA